MYNYAGSSGIELLKNGKYKSFLHHSKERELKKSIRKAIKEIINKIKNIPISNFIHKDTVGINLDELQKDLLKSFNNPENKYGEMVLHWRVIYEKYKFSLNQLDSLNNVLFPHYFEPIIKKYNDSLKKEELMIKAKMSKMTCELTSKLSRTKADSLDYFFFNEEGIPMYNNLIIIGDGISDGDMIKRGNVLKEKYDINCVSIVVQQVNTPKWMLEDESHIILPYCKKIDPNIKIGGVPLLYLIYEYLMAPYIE